MKGILFRKIENEAQLQAYHNHMPVMYIIQEFLEHPLEVSVFYYRKPCSPIGRITALIGKELLTVRGDGTSTILKFVQQHPDARGLLPRVEKENGLTLDRILPADKTFCVSHIANLFNGARFKNLKEQIDATLLKVFDQISYTSQFYFGRYDIKCHSVDDLKRGIGF